MTELLQLTNLIHFLPVQGLILHTKIPYAIGDVTEYLTGQYPNNMFIEGTNENEIINIVIMLKSSFSKGNDDISSKIVQNVIMEIASPLSMVLNVSLATETFPDKLRIEKIVPMYKYDDKLLVNNYRPISDLPFFKNT